MKTTVWTIQDNHAHDGVELFPTMHSAALSAWYRIIGWGPRSLDLPGIMRALNESGSLWILCRCGRELTISRCERD